MSFSLCFFHNHQVLPAHQHVVSLVNGFSQASEEIIVNPGVDIIREILRRQSHTGREVRRLGFLEHPSALPRSTLRLGCWKWRKVCGFPWKHRGEHMNILELRAVINGGPLAFTVRIKHSFQGGPSNGLNGDSGSIG